MVIGLIGALYGTTAYGGANVAGACPSGCGVIYELMPPSRRGGPWTESTLYSFGATGSDGKYPYSGVTVDAAGNLYGTTMSGGVSNAGTVFRLSPPAAPGCVWTESVLYDFGASGGGAYDRGIVFAATPPTIAGGAWGYRIIHNFTTTEGTDPVGGLTISPGGVLYGTTFGNFRGKGGTIFALKPPAVPGGDWASSVLHLFAPGTGQIEGSLLVAPDGAIYGTTSIGGVSSSSCAFGSCGTVFQLVP